MTTNNYKNTEYFAVTKMGKFVKESSFEKLQEKLKQQNEDKIELYVAFMYDTPYETQYGKRYWWPQIQIINEKQEPTSYQRGMFKVVHIFPDCGSYYFKGRKLVFRNCITDEIVEKYVKGNNLEATTIADFYNSLREILFDLNKEACNKLIKEP